MQSGLSLKRVSLVLSAALLLLHGCASRPITPHPENTDRTYRGSLPELSTAPLGDAETDGPPDNAPADLDAITDAVPREEPLSKYGNPPVYYAEGQKFAVMKSGRGYVERGIASWYGRKFQGRRTSSGEPYDPWAMTAAHTRLPLPTYVQVTNLDNGKKVIVKVNDRGPFRKNRVLDLSYAAALKLGITGKGTGRVEVRALSTPNNVAKSPSRPISERATPTTEVSPPAKAAAKPPGANQHFIQVAAFTERTNAESLRQRLQNHVTADPIQIETVETQRGAVYRVRIGPLDAARSQQTTERLAQLGIESPHIVTE